MTKEIEIEITRLDPNLSLPKYQTKGAVAFDFQAAEDYWLQPRAIEKIRSGLIITVPKGYVLLIASRSSGPTKLGLSLPHGLGIIDQDYSGPKDEILIQMINLTDQPVQIKKGTRIAQGLIAPISKAQWQEVPLAARNDSRGGFGSTGHR